MNTTASAKTFTVAAITVAAIAAAAFGIVAERNATAAPQKMVKLERVVIEGKRTVSVAQLPRVVIEGRRAATQVASAAVCATTTIC